MHREGTRIGRWMVMGLALVLIACGPRLPAVEPTPKGQTPTPAPGLAESEWLLTLLNGEELVAGSQITLRFAGGQASGFAGCNAYGGGYREPSGGTLSIGELAVTAQACLEPDGVMEQEATYIRALREVVAYEMDGERLEMRNEAGEASLVFERIRHEAMNPEDLIGTIWALTSLDGEGPVEGSSITLGFHDDRHASGHAGCREYAASYQASGDEIRFPSLTMTGDEGCLADEALYRQEGRYTDALSWATRYRVSEEALEIWTARGEVLLYEPGLPGGEPDAEGSRPCEAYQELTAKAGSVERRAVVTSYRCQNATIDSTGQSPANPPDLTLEAGGRLEFHLGAGEVPDRLELRLYPEAGIASTFFRWPEELPLEIEPVDRVEPEPGLAFEYRPEGPAGAYSLVVRATWGEAVDVFYALSFEVR